jgi:hypothetical protein
VKPVFQKLRHAPPQMGDCLRACVASIFELPLETVPHFVQGEANINDGYNENWFSVLYEWALLLGFETVLLDAKDTPIGEGTIYFALSPCIATGKSTVGGWNHSCVWRNGALAHDPAGRGGFVGEPLDYIVFVPIDPARHMLAGETGNG